MSSTWLMCLSPSPARCAPRRCPLRALLCVSNASPSAVRRNASISRSSAALVEPNVERAFCACASVTTGDRPPHYPRAALSILERLRPPLYSPPALSSASPSGTGTPSGALAQPTAPCSPSSSLPPYSSCSCSCPPLARARTIVPVKRALRRSSVPQRTDSCAQRFPRWRSQNSRWKAAWRRVCAETAAPSVERVRTAVITAG
ncbi:hypothetical protein C8J57DRAFT_119827 [Mycena rebaudengoi]|nr:hypothetical protein C8J57DRAFT_119827 [Mycena rebaudengoi]